MSLLVSGDEKKISNILRKLTSDFLEKNKDYMIHHPALTAAASVIRRSEDFVFAASLFLVTQKNVWDKFKD